MERLPVAIIGATGVAGQQFVAALQHHPWFTVTGLAASARSAGKTYAQALRHPETGASQWWDTTPPSANVLALDVQNADDFDPRNYAAIFTGVESSAARQLEPRLARTRPVFSTASAFRMEPDVPLVLAGVNPDHLALIEHQRRQRGWEGYIIPVPNCTVTGLAISLAPLYTAFGVQSVVMTSLQALSGAGKSPGVLALDIVDNVIPYIVGEEDKVARELGKLLGTLSSSFDGMQIDPAPIPTSATCTRVPVIDGHTLAITVSLTNPATLDEVRAAWQSAGAEVRAAGLPSCPSELIAYNDDPFRPQPRLDRDAGGGMTTTVGRLRPAGAVPNGISYVALSHNTKMGAAKGAVLIAEWLRSQGRL